MKIYLIVILTFLSVACNQAPKVKAVRQYDRLSDEKLYNRKLLNLIYSDSISEDLEIYITREKDTFFNQFKILKDAVVIDSESSYYDLTITKTNKVHLYRGVITLHSQYESLKIDKDNRRTLEFNFCNQNKDSIWLTFANSKTKNTIEFEFENHYNNKLQGILYQQVERDTLVNNEEMINLNRVYLLVDNYVTTDNLFLESFEIPKTKIFTMDKSEFKLVK